MAAIIELSGDKRKFLAGMRWSTHENRPTRKKMREIAETEGAWVAFRRGHSIIQSGYCQPLPEFKKPQGLLAIAAMIAEAKPEPWLGVFDLGDDLYWYIAVRDNNGILPDGDVIGTYEEVSVARANTAGLGHWTYVDGGREELASLMRNASAPVSVRDIRSRPWIMPVVGGTLLAGVTVGGLWTWDAHEAQMAHERAMAMARERAMIAAMQAKKAQKAEQVTLPWTLDPVPSGFLRSCGKLFDHLPISRYGWMLSSADCQWTGNAVSLHTQWQMGPGASTAYMPTGHLSTNGKQVSGRPVTVPLRVDRDSQVENAQSALRNIYAMTQPLGVSVRITKNRATAPALLPGATARKANIEKREKPWQTWEVSMKTTLPVLSLSGWGKRLDAIQGFRLLSISTKNSGRWEMTGKQYVSQIPLAEREPLADVQSHAGVQPHAGAQPHAGMHPLVIAGNNLSAKSMPFSHGKPTKISHGESR